MSPRRVALLFFAGTLLLQAAWVLALPPYRGSDEFDHVYRAASVAHGHWRTEVVPAEDGRGALIPVPRDIVVDATPVCESYEYTGPDNCHPVDSLDGGLVTVASAAALYNPVYYAIVGAPSLVLDGAPAVYAMRLVSSVLCALLLALSAGAAALWSRSRWPVAGVALSATPVVAYTTVVTAPNGLEIAAAVCVWTGMIGIARAQTAATQRLAISLASLGAVAMLNTRTLAPLWLLMIVLTCAAALGLRRTLQVLRARAGWALGGAVVASAGGILAISWTLTNPALTTVEVYDLPDVSPWGPALREIPLWVFQSIAAFPLRNDPAPMLVYACWMVLFAALVGAALRQGGRRWRAVLVASMTLSLAVPFAVTVATVTTAGTFWQGRYTLPFAVGVTLLAGLALDDAPPRHRLLAPLTVAGAACLVVAQAAGPTAVRLNEGQTSPLSGDPRWWTVPGWGVCALAVLGAALWVTAASKGRAAPASPPGSRPPVSSGSAARSGS